MSRGNQIAISFLATYVIMLCLYVGFYGFEFFGKSVALMFKSSSVDFYSMGIKTTLWCLFISLAGIAGVLLLNKQNTTGQNIKE